MNPHRILEEKRLNISKSGEKKIANPGKILLLSKINALLMAGAKIQMMLLLIRSDNQFGKNKGKNTYEEQNIGKKAY